MIVETLKNSYLGRGLEEGEIARAAALFGEIAIAEGKAVFLENLPGETLYLIARGTVQISRMLAEGDEQTLVILGPEDLFGEMAVIEEAPRLATARVAEDALLMTLKRDDFSRLCDDDPGLGLKLMRNIVKSFNQRLRDSQEEYREMLLTALDRSKAQGERP